MPVQHYKAETYRARSSVGYLVKRATALMVECLEPGVAEHGLTFTQWVVLMHLRDRLSVSASDICSQLRHDSGALTRMIDQLEARGLVQRQRSLEDRRAVELSLTDAGAQMVESLIPIVVDKLNLSLSDFSRTEVTELTRLLTKLVTSLESGVATVGETA